MNLSLSLVTKKVRPHFYASPITLLDQISFEAPQSSCTALLGPNGSGKTTTLNVILGLWNTTSGSILFNGEPLSSKIKSQIGYMPASSSLPAQLTVLEFLEFRSKIFQISFSKAKNKMEQFGLLSYAGKKIGALSTGLKHQLAWVQASMHSPQLLILDEPLSGLDPLARKKLHENILAEQQRGATILLTTHDLTQAAWCDAIIFLRQGRIVQTQIKKDFDFAALLPFYEPL